MVLTLEQWEKMIASSMEEAMDKYNDQIQEKWLNLRIRYREKKIQYKLNVRLD